MNIHRFGDYDPANLHVRNGWEYATDTKVAARRKTDLPDTDNKHPDYTEIFSDWPELVIPVSAIANISDAHPCRDCDGSGKIDAHSECSCCHGTGSEGCPTCGIEHSCHACGGSGEEISGKTPCDRCGGSGKWLQYVIEGRYFDKKYVDIIREEMPDALCAVKDRLLVAEGAGGQAVICAIINPRTKQP